MSIFYLWGFLTFFFLNYIALIFGWNASIPFTHTGFARMQTDLPKITEKIAAWSPVFPDYDVTHVRHHAAVVTDSIWSTVHALKLSLLPGLLLIELPLILTSTLIYGCNRVWNWRKGGGSMGIATLFWTKETSNRLFLPPVVTGGAFSLGITWDWQSNGRFHETSFFWGGLWPDFSAPETSLLGDPVSPTQFTTMFTVYENEAVGTKPKAMSGRRRLAGDQVSAKPPSYRPLAGKGVSKPPPPKPPSFPKHIPPSSLLEKPKAESDNPSKWDLENIKVVEQTGTLSERLIFESLHMDCGIQTQHSDPQGMTRASDPRRKRSRSRSRSRSRRGRSRTRSHQEEDPRPQKRRKVQFTQFSSTFDRATDPLGTRTMDWSHTVDQEEEKKFETLSPDGDGLKAYGGKVSSTIEKPSPKNARLKEELAKST